MELYVDTREHKSEYERITKQFDSIGVKYFRTKLFVGDYQSLSNARLVVDRKKDLQEIVGNVTKQHDRFKAELVRAQEAGIKVIILCEHGEGIKQLEDVYKWQNPRSKLMIRKTINGVKRWYPKYPYATPGPKLYKILTTIRDKYSVDFVFCEKENTGKEIVRLLGGGADE